MKFAISDTGLIEAIPGGSGICPCCSQPVLAKCGVERINHWAHLRTINCDSWWEPETAWHREWKNQFPREWQEKFLPDLTTGEKHMADVQTETGLVLEFQHSHMDAYERISREKFYRNMIWVIDGTRLKRDFVRFNKGKISFTAAHKSGLFIVPFPDECFPKAWLKNTVPVFFDFKDLEMGGGHECSHNLYCLFPNTGLFNSLVAVITKNHFIDLCRNGNLISLLKTLLDEHNQSQQMLKANRLRQQQAIVNQLFFRQKVRRRRL